MRRDTPTEISKPAGKRRKIGSDEYRRVLQPIKEKGEKRKSDEEYKIDDRKRRKTDPKRSSEKGNRFIEKGFC